MWEYNSIYYTNNYNNLDEWFKLVISNDEVYPFCKIPYYEWFNKYIDNIKEESVESVKNLLRCLLCPINRKLDKDQYETHLIRLFTLWTYEGVYNHDHTFNREYTTYVFSK